jgi:rod shape determining protein RodA
MSQKDTTNRIDWICFSIYVTLVIMGWLNIYSSSLSSTENTYEKQLIFIILTVPLLFVVLTVEAKIFEKYAVIFFIIAILSLIGLFAFGKVISGQRCWYAIGNFTLQPSEFAKTATALALAKFLSDSQIKLSETKRQLQALLIICLPVLLILAQPDAGSALIYSIFIIVLYREGLPAWYVWIGFLSILFFILSLLFSPIYILTPVFLFLTFIYYKSRPSERRLGLSALIFGIIAAIVLSVNYVFNNVFSQHHRDRFNILLGKSEDLKRIGYNTNQSEIAIGSGGWIGKGFLEGTQTKGGFVPAQHTDYIFTTVGEEWGFVGCLVVILLFFCLFYRILYLAERQKTKFNRIYGYCVAGILFTHFFVNIAMVLGIFPTIGVPLPFFSYGGSGLWGFSILLFIFLKMDSNRINEW